MASVELFVAAGTQWRVVAGMGGQRVIGLDYNGLRAAGSFTGVPITPERFDEIRLIEAGALQAMNGDNR